ncbi:hypothetical protein [Rossellomorea sp. NPDC077527]|uniref:hypothetical protein n=1 Tax=Rossellomorea sp. NPDC077527 TaxID=3364510 RepID=UPI0037C5E73E
MFHTDVVAVLIFMMADTYFSLTSDTYTLLLHTYLIVTFVLTIPEFNNTFRFPRILYFINEHFRMIVVPPAVMAPF